MKKITLLILLVIVSVFDAQAQFPEGFETTVPPAGWTTFRGANGLGTVYDWTVSTTIFASGAQSATVRYENITPNALAEDWLVTPQFTPTAATNILSFQQRQSFTAEYGTEFTIRVSTASQTTIADFVVVDTQTEADLGITFGERFVDLSPYNDTPIYVAFVMTQDDGDTWFVDDVDLIADAVIPGCPANPIPIDTATGVVIPDGTLTLSWDVPATGDAATGYEFFFGEVSGTLTSLGTTTDPEIDLINLAYATTYYWMVVPYNAGGSATGCAEWSFTTEDTPPPPANDNLCDATLLTLGTPSTGGAYTNAQATLETSEVGGTCWFLGDEPSNSVWFYFVAPASGEVQISTVYDDGSLGDTQLTLYSLGDCNDLTTLTELACDEDDDDDINEDSLLRALLQYTSLTSGETYYVQVDGYDENVGTFDIGVFDLTTLSVNSQDLNSFTYFPNPVKNTLNLNAQSNIQNVSVYNMLGQEVLRSAPNSLNNEVNMTSLQIGAYFVKVTINDATETIRIIKE